MTTRDGISFIDQLLCTNRDDPQNARYLAPLARAEDEQMAHSMADAIYCASVDNFTDDITKEEADRVWEQCLIDARRMICEPEYEDIFKIKRCHRLERTVAPTTARPSSLAPVVRTHRGSPTSQSAAISATAR